MADKKKVATKFVREKETKNAVRFQETPEANKAPVVGSLYVQKWWVQDAKTLNVTLEVE